MNIVKGDMMDMESDGKTLVGIIICSVLIVAVIAFTVVAVNLKESESKKSNVRPVANNETRAKGELAETVLGKLTDGFYKVLYVYTEDYSGDLVDYLMTLNNNQKLYIANVMALGNEGNRRLMFNDLKNKLVGIVGTDLEVHASDFYIDESEKPYYKYDIAGGYFTYNNEYDGGTDSFTDMGGMSIYNYKVKEIKDNIIYTYGLYKDSTRDVDKLQNGRGLERYIGIDDHLEEFGYTETDEQYLDNIYNNDIGQFLVFEYHYILVDNCYVLSDFIVEN